jgi:hypothetical protein
MAKSLEDLIDVANGTRIRQYLQQDPALKKGCGIQVLEKDDLGPIAGIMYEGEEEQLRAAFLEGKFVVDQLPPEGMSCWVIRLEPYYLWYSNFKIHR